jgi:hypothetical protein
MLVCVHMKLGITLGIAALGALGITPALGGMQMPFAAAAYAPPQSCMQWYDGCNVCDKNADGAVSCSHRMCENAGAGFCMATSTPESAQ